MILKNEAHSIASTLNSVKNHIDKWVILDTGSTDNTIQVVKETLQDVPGVIHETPFIDFATTRNLAIDLAGTEQEFLLLLDADDEVTGCEKLREFLAEELKKQFVPGAYYVQVDTGIKFDSARVMRAGSGWKYTGVVHEVLSHPMEYPAPRIPDVLIKHFPDDLGASKSVERWKRDAILLAKEVDKNPNDARSTFYLAQTLKWLGKPGEAIKMYLHRISLGGWWEEVYESKMSIVECQTKLGLDKKDLLLMYLDIHSQFPNRAEPLFFAAQLCYAEGNHPLTYMYARRATEIPRPAEVKLFVDEAIYEWKAHDLVAISAYYISAFKVGKQSAEIALSFNPNDERMKKNLEFYKKLIPPMKDSSSL